MSTFVSLGSRGPVVGVADMTGLNPVNWTIQFDPATINCNVPFFEISHIVVNGAPGSTFTVWLDSRQWDSTQTGQQNGWDPAVPLPLKPGQYVYIMYSNKDTDGFPPMATIWLRYDQDIIANRNNVFQQTPGGGT